MIIGVAVALATSPVVEDIVIHVLACLFRHIAVRAGNTLAEGSKAVVSKAKGKKKPPTPAERVSHAVSASSHNLKKMVTASKLAGLAKHTSTDQIAEGLPGLAPRHASDDKPTIGAMVRARRQEEGALAEALEMLASQSKALASQTALLGSLRDDVAMLKEARANGERDGARAEVPERDRMRPRARAARTHAPPPPHAPPSSAPTAGG